MAEIVNIDAEVARHQNSEKLSGMQNNQNIREQLKKSLKKGKLGLKPPRSRPAKKTKIVTEQSKNAEKLSQEDALYKYTHYLDALKSGIIPSLYNNLTFKDPEFEMKIKTNKDYKVAVNSILDFEIFDPYMGLIFTLAGLSVEQYYENKAKPLTQVEAKHPHLDKFAAHIAEKLKLPVQHEETNTLVQDEQ